MNNYNNKYYDRSSEREKPRVKPFQYIWRISMMCIEQLSWSYMAESHWKLMLLLYGVFVFLTDFNQNCILFLTIKINIIHFIRIVVLLFCKILELSFSFRVRFYFMRSCYITMRECMCGSKGFIETSWSILPPESKIRTHQPSYTIFTREGKPMANNAISNNISNNNNKPSTYWSNMPIIYIAMCECKRSKVALQQVTWHSYIAA